jgi:RNA polymerase sigma factor (TIGR02999 family)
MSDVTRLIEAAAGGNRQAAADLLPLVYDQMRKLAAVRLAAEAPGHSLNPTALVHEAYLRLIGDQQFDGRGHFFAAAAEAMRRILVEQSRRRKRHKHGGQRRRLSLEAAELLMEAPSEDLAALDEAIIRLTAHDPVKAEVVQLYFFADLSRPKIARSLHLSLATADLHWTFTRLWCHSDLTGVGCSEEF